MEKEERILETLLSEAREQAKRNAAPAVRNLAFTNPDAWAFRGQVQLVHRESTDGASIETLVGLFDQHIHPSGARRLVAARLRVDVKATIEYVTGDHWVGKAMEAKRRPPENRVKIVEDLVLDSGLSAYTVPVTCTLVGGGVARVLLEAPTIFESHTPRTILALPAQMDVLEGLDRGSKERVWREVKKVLGEDD